MLLIVGSNFYKASIVGTYEERLHVLTKELENQIVFTGYIDNEDMPAVYRMADVVVLPSMWDARRTFDWEKQWECSIDPQTAMAIRDSRAPEQEDSCSMCGKFCAVRSMNKALNGEYIDIL